MKKSEYLIYSYNPKSEEIKINIDNIIKSVGYKSSESASIYNELLEELLVKANDIIIPQCGFVILPEGKTVSEGNFVILDGIKFETQRIVSSPLRKMSSVAIFTATIGKNFDEWSKKTFNSNDPLAGYFIDLLGSEFAESLADWCEAKINYLISKEGKFCSNRYSPGYCGWSVSEQKMLFSFFPDNFCGISLTESSLMNPHKSVSGIIGIGTNINRMEYPCNVCKVSHCYKN